VKEFLEQFLAESRELVEQATADLLALEERPDQRERLDGAFRGFHTLKGAAAIMEFEPMVRTLHAAEDVLSTARATGGGLSPILVGDCLAALDQVLQWLDVLDSGGEMPAGADEAANALVRRLGSGSSPAAPAAAEGQDDWQAALLARHPHLAGQAAYALRYIPGPQSFFEGLDPLAELRALKGLLTLDMTAAGELPELQDLDPFTSLTTFELLLAGTPAAAVIEGLRREGAVVDLVPLSKPAAIDALGLPPGSAELLRAQILMLRAAPGEGALGRAGSAARVASNVLRHAGLTVAAERLVEFVSRAPRDDTEALAVRLHQLLAGKSDGAPDVEEGPAQPASEAAVRSLRVDVERVDALVNLAGELLVAKNALGHAVRFAERGADAHELTHTLRLQHAQLDRLVTDLQHSVLSMRVLPMRQVFQRFPRIVREMVAALGKPTRLVTEGDATEADKTIVEGLFEPLLHIVRNAMDHGVETAAERSAGGKPPSATITMRARREGDRVVIEVEDDGRGLDLQRIRDVAAEGGVAEPEVLRTMNDEQVADLVFAAGFSTARTISEISGRGVGMDAVRSAVERIGGHVGLESRKGLGTLVRLSLPFTILMTPVLTVEAAGQMFGIPLDAVLETVRLPAQDIRPIGTGQAFVLRERTVPLIELAGVLESGAHARPGSGALVVVAQAAGQVAGLAVERLGERLDVMLKPMDGLLANMPAIMGTTLLGDGRVLLVLDLSELLG
jgi:two-component system chemotaxis sensor kinase CheA